MHTQDEDRSLEDLIVHSRARAGLYCICALVWSGNQGQLYDASSDEKSQNDEPYSMASRAPMAGSQLETVSLHILLCAGDLRFTDCYAPRTLYWTLTVY